MAVPLDPSVASIVTQALQRGGRVNPTSTQLQEAIDHALQEVKSDIMFYAATHPHLLATSTTVTTRGQQRYAVPADFNEPSSIALLEGPPEWAGTAQGGAALTITLANSLSVSADDLIGRYILITAGPGIEEYRQILAYNAGIRQATVDLPWLVTPTSSTQYLIIQSERILWPSDTRSEMDTRTNATMRGTPSYASIHDQEFILYPVPDSVFGLRARYWVDLSKLDETGPLFIQLLREWRSLWVQGVAVKTMQRFDEDRYIGELQIYERMLLLLSGKSSSVGEVVFRDI